MFESKNPKSAMASAGERLRERFLPKIWTTRTRSICRFVGIVGRPSNMMLDYLRQISTPLCQATLPDPNTIRYVIEYRCVVIVRLISESDPPFGRLIDVGAGSGEMSARLIEQGFAETAIAIEPDQRNFQLLQRYSAATPSSEAVMHQ